MRVHVHGDVHTLVTNAVVSGAWSTGNPGSCQDRPRRLLRHVAPGVTDKEQERELHNRERLSEPVTDMRMPKNHNPDAHNGTTITITR